ncbi:MAG: hypothetical protein JXA60_08295, partial [Candidatus Coatesbacteria bacterium]|nr:hypothetical protein [Candidatus Coatesbacteria bacterium]
YLKGYIYLESRYLASRQVLKKASLQTEGQKKIMTEYLDQTIEYTPGLSILIYDFNGSIIYNGLSSSIREVNTEIDLYSEPTIDFNRSLIYYTRVYEEFVMTLYLESPLVSEAAYVSKVLTFLWIIAIISSLGFLLIAYEYAIKPYRKLKEVANTAPFITSAKEHESDIERITFSFEETIKALRDKQKELELLYKAANEKAAAYEAYNENILKSIHSALIVTDIDSRIVLCNSSFSRNFLDNKEILSAARIDETSIDDFFKEILNSARMGNHIEDVEFFKKDKIYSVSVSIVTDQKDILQGYSILAVDVTKIRELEREIAEKRNLAELGTLSAGLAHEIRNSLGTILGYSKLLQKEKISEEAFKYLESILNEIKSSENLVRSLMDFAKKPQLELIKVKLSDLLNSALQKLFLQFGERKVFWLPDENSFEVEIETDIPLFESALYNILKNAFEASMDNKPIHLSITRNIDSVILFIKDEGKGIAEDKQEDVFMAFYTSKEKGLGLGLALVRKNLSLLNSSISIADTSEKGTTFKIVINSVC